MENPVTDTTNNSSSNNVTISTTNSTTRIVRINWIKFLFYSWKRISTLSKLVVASSIFLVIAQVATGITILATSRNETCDQPLQSFIIVYVVRVILSCPFYVAQHFEKAEQRLRFQRQQERDRRREDQVRIRRLQRREQRRRTRAEQSSNQATDMTSSSSSQQEAVISSNASTHSTVIEPRPNWFTSWGERLRSLVDLFAILWFIVGNYLIFTSQTCSRDAPKLFYTSLAYILIGYFIVIIPLVLCTSVIFCLPCVLVVMRVLNISEMEGMVNQGGREEEISKIPIYRYKATSESGINDDSSTTQEPSVTTTTTQQSLTHKEKGFVSKLLRFRHHRHAIDTEQGLGYYDDISITPVEDALCCICLSEYEDKDLLCKLWCGHHFHKSCVTEWLTLNRKCPLCKQDFRGKEYEDDSEDIDDDDNDVEEEMTGERRQIRERTAADEISMTRLSNNNNDH